MSYIGNSHSPLILGPNVRDDIVPNGIDSVFNLSQEVPGGEPSNVFVFINRYVVEELVYNTPSLLFVPVLNTIEILLDQDLAGVFSSINVADFVHISGSLNNDGVYPVLSVVYNGNTVSVSIDGNLLAGDDGNLNVIVSVGKFSGWYVLNPGVDYTIAGTNATYNKELHLSFVPVESDQIYVLHKGEATYNFTPSQNSVGPDQLQPNLRNFLVDRYTGDGSTTDFLLSQEAIDSRSLILTVDGTLVDGDSLGYLAGTWSLIESVPSSGIFDTVSFDVAPLVGEEIRVLHLGFSTVSRRALYSPLQTPQSILPGSVGSLELQNNSVTASKLANNAVTTSALANDSVTGIKILLNNNDALRSKDNASNPHDILKLSGTNTLEISSPVDISIDKPLFPTLLVNLGSLLKRFLTIYAKNVNLDTSLVVTDGLDTSTVTPNQITTESVVVNGNISVTGTVDGVDVSNLQTQVDSIALGFPVGAVIQFAGSILPPGWLWCDGASHLSAAFPSLFSAIGYTYGGSGPNFNVPDFRGFMPFGRMASGPYSTLGATFGQLDHTHEIPDHTHDDVHTHNIPGHHHEHLVSQGSNLQINSSGSHTTAIGHNHTASIPPSGSHEHTVGNIGESTPQSRQLFASSENLIVSGIYPARNPNHSHNVVVSTGTESQQHTHTADTQTENDLTLTHHTHEVKTVALENAGSLGLSTNHHFVVGLPNIGGTVLKDINSGDDGEHTHDYTVVTTTESQTHTHPINTSTPVSGSHDHVVRGKVPTTDSNHIHPVTIPPFVGNSTSTGDHTHSSSSIGGKIGKVTGGSNGDTNFVSGARSVMTTGQISSPGPGTTTGGNPPSCVINFIIKV